MAERFCDDCKQRMLPYVPRKTRADGAKVCWACAVTPSGGLVSGKTANNDLEYQMALSELEHELRKGNPNLPSGSVMNAVDQHVPHFPPGSNERHIDDEISRKAAKGDSTDLWHPGDLLRHLKEDHDLPEQAIPTHLSLMQWVHGQEHEPDQVQTKDGLVGWNSVHQHAPKLSKLTMADIEKVDYQFHGAGKLALADTPSAIYVLRVRTKTGGKGHLAWDASTGEIQDLYVTEESRRKGLATLMYQHAKSLGFDPKHSTARSYAGNAWAKSVGGWLPMWQTLSPRDPRSKEARMNTNLRVVAHDSGDGETIYHCPFCGSGQVIARSDKTIECEFCHTAFTVQVQPEMSAFPQTINGVPVDVPGMPGEIGSEAGEDPNAPMDPNSLGGSGDETDAPGGGGGDSSAAPVGGESDDDDSGDSGGNPFAKSSLRTESGHELPIDWYVRHLAYRAMRETPLNPEDL